MKPVVLKVRGLGHIPSFKNKKQVAKRRNGPLFIMTRPEFQVWMERCVDSFESQLRSAYQTLEGGTLMARSLPSWIACVVPSNDSVLHIIEEHIKVEWVEPGEEGAVITIERL